MWVKCKLILLKEKIQGPLGFSSRSKTRRMRTFIKRWLDGSLQHFWSGDHHLMVWTAGHQQHCIVSEFYAHCDVITRHLKMRVVGTPSLVVQLPHVNMPAAFPCTYVLECSLASTYVSSSLESHMHWIALQHSEIVRHMMWQSRQIKSFTAGWAGIAHSVVGENSAGSSITSMIHI